MTTPPPRLRRRTSSVAQPRCAPELELALERVALPELPDRAAEKAADLVPAVPQGSTGERQTDPDVEIPERPRRAARDAELERGDGAAGADDARQLRERRARVVDVAEQVGDGEVVERCVRKGNGLGGAPARAPPLRRACAARVASISSLWSSPVTREAVAQRALRRRGPFPSRRRARDRRPLAVARRGSAARADPGRARARRRRGRTTGRAARRALARGRFATTRLAILATWASPTTSSGLRVWRARTREPGDVVSGSSRPSRPPERGSTCAPSTTPTVVEAGWVFDETEASSRPGGAARGGLDRGALRGRRGRRRRGRPRRAHREPRASCGDGGAAGDRGGRSRPPRTFGTCSALPPQLATPSAARRDRRRHAASRARARSDGRVAVRGGDEVVAGRRSGSCSARSRPATACRCRRPGMPAVAYMAHGGRRFLSVRRRSRGAPRRRCASSPRSRPRRCRTHSESSSRRSRSTPPSS